MADSAAKVELVGWRELQRAARQAGAELPRKMRAAQKEIAEDVVAGAQSRAAGLPGRAGQSFADGLKAKAEQRSASVTLDATKAATILGDEFGAKRYPQFQPWRGNQYTDPLAQDVGYALHPELRAQRSHIIDAYDDIVDDVVHHMAKD